MTNKPLDRLDVVIKEMIRLAEVVANIQDRVTAIESEDHRQRMQEFETDYGTQIDADGLAEE